MAKLSIFLLGLTIVLSNTVSCNEVELEYKDLLEEALSSYHASIRQETYPPSDKESSEDSKNNLNDTKFVCTGGLDPSTITRTEYVKEFAKGPCSPAVVIPGIGASKLIVEVDCPVFKEAHPEDFKACGWARCSGLQSPSKEYKMWLPTVLAPMSISIDSEKARNCFIAVFGFDDSQAIPTGKLVYKTGLKVSVLGMSPETKTKKQSNCAFDAISNLNSGNQTPATVYLK